MDLDDAPSLHEPSAETALWRRWRTGADEAARKELLDMHLPYARIVAATYYGKRMHDEIEFAEYYQLASLGLIDAMERFDAERGIQFRTFAARRMHGAILDGLESLTEKQQQIAARQRLLKQRHEDIKESAAEGIGRSPAKGPPRDSEQILKYVAEAGLAFALAWILDGTGMLDNGGELSNSLPFYRSVELKQLRERIVELVNTLSEQERTVIHRHYYQEIPFEEIATSLQLTRGRISQIHKKALERIKAAMRAGDGCDLYG